jgi:hypothetical protein
VGARQRARVKDVYENRERCMLDNAGLLMGLAFGALRIDTTALVRMDVQARGVLV